MTSIHHGSIGYALSPAGKAYKVRNNPPLSNHPKSLFQGCGVVGFVWAVRVSCGSIQPRSYPWATPVSYYSTLVARDPWSLLYS